MGIFKNSRITGKYDTQFPENKEEFQQAMKQLAETLGWDFSNAEIFINNNNVRCCKFREQIVPVSQNEECYQRIEGELIKVYPLDV
jgi:hypothetical protein